MKAWLLALGLALFCTVRAKWTKIEDVTHEQVLGRWHLIALASDCQEFQQHTSQLKSQLRSSPANVSLTENGNLRILSNMSSKEGCAKIDVNFDRREDEIATKFEAAMATDYRTYAIIKVHLERDGGICTILIAFTREPVLDSVTAEKFRRLASEENIPESQVTFLPIEENCNESK